MLFRKAHLDRLIFQAERKCNRGPTGAGSGNPRIAAVRETIVDVADTDSTGLVTGETGTGKELVANALHYDRGRAAGRW